MNKIFFYKIFLALNLWCSVVQGASFYEGLKPFLPMDPMIVVCKSGDDKLPQKLADYWPFGHIHVFEPNPDIYDTILNSSSKFKNLHLKNAILGVTSGLDTYYVAKDAKNKEDYTGFSSVLKPKTITDFFPDLIFSKKKTIKSISIKDWQCEVDSKKIDMIYLATRGTELDILKSGLACNFRCIWLQVAWEPLYENQCDYFEIMNWMSDNDFIYVASDFDAHNGDQAYGHVLYIHKETLVKFN